MVAVKDATGEVAAATRLIAGTGLAWCSGDDDLLLPFLALGAVELVSLAGHLVGDELAQVIPLVDAGGGRILRPFPGETTAEVQDYHDVATGVLASSLAKCAPAAPASASPIHGASRSSEQGRRHEVNVGTRDRR